MPCEQLRLLIFWKQMTLPLPWDPSSPMGGRTNQVLIRNWRGGGAGWGSTQTDQSHRGGEVLPQAAVHIEAQNIYRAQLTTTALDNLGLRFTRSHNENVQTVHFIVIS